MGQFRAAKPSFTGSSARLAGLVVLSGLTLSACASHGPQYSARPASGYGAAKPSKAAKAPATPVAKPQRQASAAPTEPTPAQPRYKLGAPYQVDGVWYVPADEPAYDEIGVASWYGDEFDGRSTANGERFDKFAVSAAHATLPMPSIVEVTNLDNGRTLRVRLNDRGPFKAGRILDVSRGAAQELGFLAAGTARVRVRYVGPARLDGSMEPLYVASAQPSFNLAANTVASAAQPGAQIFQPAPAAASFPTPQPTPAAAPVRASASLIESAPLAPPPAAPAYAAASWSAPTPTTYSSPSTYSSPAPISPPTPAPKPARSFESFQSADANWGRPGFTVQAGAFGDRVKAERIARGLSSAGAARVQVVDLRDRTLYRVVVGPWSDREAAMAARSRVAALGYGEAIVVSAN